MVEAKKSDNEDLKNLFNVYFHVFREQEDPQRKEFDAISRKKYKGAVVKKIE